MHSFKQFVHQSVEIDEKLAQIDLSKFCAKRDIDLFVLRKLRNILAKIGQNVFAKHLLRKSQKNFLRGTAGKFARNSE